MAFCRASEHVPVLFFFFLIIRYLGQLARNLTNVEGVLAHSSPSSITGHLILKWQSLFIKWKSNYLSIYTGYRVKNLNNCTGPKKLQFDPLWAINKAEWYKRLSFLIGKFSGPWYSSCKISTCSTALVLPIKHSPATFIQQKSVCYPFSKANAGFGTTYIWKINVKMIK